MWEATARLVIRMGDIRDACRNLVVKPRRGRPLEKPRKGWEDNFKIDCKERGCEDRR